MKSVLFITHEGFLSTIFQSQVLEHCSYINKEFDNEIQIDVLTYEVFSSQYIESCKNLERFKSGSEYKESYKIFLEKGFNIYYPLSLFLNLYLLYKFLKEKNPWAIRAMGERLMEAANRGLWQNPDQDQLMEIESLVASIEGDIEENL